MSDASKPRHDDGGATADEKRPSHAESARSLLVAANKGVLSTLDRRDGAPYGSLAEYATYDNGDAVFLLSDLAEHTANFKKDGRASLFISPGMAEGRPLALERATLIGQIDTVDEDDPVREAYLERHPHAETYVNFSDFAFWRLRVERVRYIGGFGRMSWVGQEDYREAEPDPLAVMAAGAIEHMNEDHPDALIDYVRAHTDLEEVDEPRMVNLDRFGFDVQVRRGDGRRQKVRIPFDEPLEEPSQVRPAMVELVEQAREALD